MKYLAIALVSLSLAGCATINAVVQTTCATERKLHAKYIAWAPLVRTPDRIALELANYTQIEAACLTGDPFQVLFSLTAAAKSLRK